jgi:hypothetical protein
MRSCVVAALVPAAAGNRSKRVCLAPHAADVGRYGLVAHGGPSVVGLIEGRATHVGAPTDHPGKATWMEARFPFSYPFLIG